MPKVRLTEKTIAKFPAPDPSGGDVLYLDESIKEFGVRCSGKKETKC